MKKIISLLLAVIMVCSVLYAVPVTAFAKEVDVAQSASSKPVISVESVKLNPYMGSYGEIVLKVTGATDVTYQWQAGFFDSTFDPVDLDDNEYYIGTKTNHFKILASGELDTLDFRCKITYDGGKVYSQVFHFTFLEPKVISRAYVVGVDAPVFGYGPKYKTDDILSEQYDLDRMVWYGPINDSSAPLMKSTDVYLAGKYKCRFYLDPAEGYTFNENSDCSVDGIICKVYSEKSDDGTTAYYADRVYTVSFKGTVPDGILDFKSRKPDAPVGEHDVYMGTFCLGTSDMDTEVSFDVKELPSSMSSNGYYIFAETNLIKDGKEVRDITATSVKLNSLIYGEEGRYTLEQKISLMSPTLDVLETRTQSYIVDIVKPQILTEVSVTFDKIENWVRPLYSPVTVTPGACVKSTVWNDMTLDGKYVPAGTDFIDGHTYCMQIWLESEYGYEFRADNSGRPDVTATINGMSAKVVEDLSDNKQLVIAYEFTYEKKTAPNKPTNPTNPTEPIEPSTGGQGELTDPTEHTTETTTLTETTESTETTATDPTEITETTETTVTDPTETTESTETTATIPTETIVTTEPSSGATEPSEPSVEKGILGDVNGDGKVNIKDATMIQKFAAKIIDLTDDEKLRADVNADNKNNVKDATAIQKFVAKIETGFPIGKPIQ